MRDWVSARPRPSFFTFLVSLAFALAATWAAGNLQRIADQFSYWDFEPSAAVESYAERSSMTDEGQFLFFASHPAISSGDEFDDVCSSSVEEEFGILGCYLPAPKTIFLFDVADDRLAGLEEVVASHELLHAVWDRLSTDERAELAPLLEAEAAQLETDEDFAERLQLYDRIEPGERLNELHSILGTEVAALSPELEEHYARYFADRAALTALHEASNAVFLEHQAQIEALVSELDALAIEIEADYDAYNDGYDQLNADIASFNARADSGAFRSQSEFDRERSALLARQDQLDADYASIQAKADDYDALVVQLDELNAEVDELNASINIDPPRSPVESE